MRIADSSSFYSNVRLTNKAVISIEDNLVTSVSQLRTLSLCKFRIIFKALLGKIFCSFVGLVKLIAAVQFDVIKVRSVKVFRHQPLVMNY